MARNKVVRYASDSLDSEFRENVIDFFNSAEKEVMIITGEGQAFGYQDIRWAVRAARKRGVRFRVYATSPLYVSKWLSYGCEVYKGEEDVGDHYLMVDGRSFIHSFPHARQKIGVREGGICRDDSLGAKRIKAEFKRLVSKAEKVKSGEDPLEKVLRKPSDYGVKTDSSRIDEVLCA